MPFYIDTESKVHFIDDSSYEYMLPSGSTVITDEDAAELQKPAAQTTEDLAASARVKRDSLIEAFAWRVERYSREVRLNITTTDDITALDAYMQALADIPEQNGFPSDITWPTAP